MRIEVLVGSDDPIIFPLKSSKVSLGSAESNDLCLNAEGISRKHLLILEEDDRYYIIDQGSTNGSFVNEERLVPGRKVEFTSFFPVRLGENVLVSLLSDDEGMIFSGTDTRKDPTSPKISRPKSSGESTNILTIKDLNSSARTEKLLKQREQKRRQIEKRAGSQKKKANPKKEKKINSSLVFIILIVAAAWYYNWSSVREQEDLELAQAEALKVAQQKAATAAMEKAKPLEVVKPPLVAASDLTKFSSFDRLIQDFKCLGDLEKYICGKFPQIGDGSNWGATQVGLMLNIMLDGQRYIEAAKKLVVFPPGLSPEDQNNYNDYVKEVAAVSFFYEAIPADLDYDLLKDASLTFVLFEVIDGKKTPYVAFAAVPASIKEFKEKLKPEMLNSLGRPHNAVIKLSKEYLNIYSKDL